MRTLRPAPTPPAPIIITTAGQVAAAPENVITNALPALSRIGVATAYCAGDATQIDCPSRTIPPATCPGHPVPVAGPLPGQHIVLGRRAPRAVYLVNATGTAGTRLTRTA